MMTKIEFNVYYHEIGASGFITEDAMKSRLEQTILRELAKMEAENNGCPVFTQVKSTIVYTNN